MQNSRSASSFRSAISQVSPGNDFQKMLIAINGKGAEYEITCFYKGTAFPETPIMPLTAYEKMKDMLDELTASRLRDGATLQEEIDQSFEDLNLIEDAIALVHRIGEREKQGQKHGKDGGKWCDQEWWGINGGLLLLEDLTGMTIKEAKVAWYYAVHLLLKCKKVEDNDKYGWMLLPHEMKATTDFVVAQAHKKQVSRRGDKARRRRIATGRR